MNDRRRSMSAFLVAGAVALVSSCSPDESSQSVSFELALDAQRLNEIVFVVHHSSGDFPGDDGGCSAGAAVAPRPTTTTTQGPTTTTTSAPTTTTLPPTTTTVPPPTTTTLPPPTTTTSMVVPTTFPSTTMTTTTLEGAAALDEELIYLGLAGTCGNGTREDGEECDDDNVVSNDGCDSECNAEFEFTSVVEDDGDLSITIRYGLGIPPGSTLAFCKFEGDIQAAALTVETIACDLSSGGTCNPTTNARVTASTTTTTTTTTTSTTTTSVSVTTTTL